MTKAEKIRKAREIRKIMQHYLEMQKPETQASYNAWRELSWDDVADAKREIEALYDAERVERHPPGGDPPPAHAR